MLAELSASLAHIAEVVEDHFGVDRFQISATCDNLGRGVAYQPDIFANYFELGRAIMAQEYDTAQNSLQQLITVPTLPGSQIVGLGELKIETSARYARMLEEDEPYRLDLIAPPSQDMIAFRSILAESMELIANVAPALSDEISGLARQIVLVSQGPRREVVFDGGSHYQLWNALFLNIDRPRSRVALAEVLAHECGHILLFGHTIEEALTLNDDAARYASPLRDDPRPMDGIYHATFVSARMAWLLDRLLDSDLLDDCERAEAAQAAVRDRENFIAGNELIAEYGKLSKLGLDIIDGARDYIASSRVSA